jgi:peptidoglycan/LPS O-acetylase OafA/YrhL
MPTPPTRFYSLDVLRGAAALTVVFWHWQHFFLFGGVVVPPTTAQPLHDVFFLFYGAGWMAVDLFFSLSGFIFFWLYGLPVSEGRLSARDFFVLRASRLYPLHLVTLLAVAAGQRVFRHATGGYSFMYGFNDRYHFLLNLGLASGWGLERGPSFNAPVWSVSVEVALYITFFVVCRIVRPRLISALTLSAAGFLVVAPANVLVGRGVGSFFLGGALYFAHKWIRAKDFNRPLAYTLPFALAAAWVYVILGPGELLRLGAMPWRSEDVRNFWPVPVLLFPLTIFTLVVLETERGTLGRRAAPLGNISYSSYLLHFPLQLAVAIATTIYAVDHAVFLSPYTLFAFFAVLIAASLASYYWFEAPAQRRLRAWLIARRSQTRVA